MMQTPLTEIATLDPAALSHQLAGKVLCIVYKYSHSVLWTMEETATKLSTELQRNWLKRKWRESGNQKHQ